MTVYFSFSHFFYVPVYLNECHYYVFQCWPHPHPPEVFEVDANRSYFPYFSNLFIEHTPYIKMQSKVVENEYQIYTHLLDLGFMTIISMTRHDILLKSRV